MCHKEVCSQLSLTKIREMFALTLSFLVPDEEKINMNFYFHTSLLYLRRFYEGLKGLHKTFRSSTKKYESKVFAWSRLTL